MSEVRPELPRSKQPALMEAYASSPYLKYMKISSFGAFSQMTVGPFSPHLNVVFGKNEAGKTTIAAFVSGVLFGWEESRGRRNTYKPENAERAGKLLFSASRQSYRRGRHAANTTAFDDDEPAQGGDETLLELSRLKNADGLQGDTTLIKDIDKDTFRTMFWLNSDELRTLRNTTDITAKLLTAGSGTSESPARALSIIQERLAQFTSRSSNAEASLVRLTEERNRLRAQLQEASETMDQYRRQDQEYHELEPQRTTMLQRIADLNREIEALMACKEAVDQIETERRALESQRDRLREEERQAIIDKRTFERGIGYRLARLSSSEDRSLRDSLDGLEERQTKARNAVEMAQSNLSASNAAFEVLNESSDDATLRHSARRNRAVQILLSIILPLFLVAGGVGLFVYGRSGGSLSYMALGLVFIVFALLLAAGSLFLIFRPDKKTDQLHERLQDAQWVMLQDRKRLESCQAEEDAVQQDIRAAMDDMGLNDAEGSIRRARSLLDEAREVRADIALCQQRQQAATSRLTDVENRLADTKAQRIELLQRAGLEDDATAMLIQQNLDHRMQQRTELLEISETVNSRSGELRQELAAARQMKDFDSLKIRHQEVCTRLADSMNEFVRLLLAKRMLEAAIATWESKSQPEVYRQAGRLLSIMTNGRWTGVSLTPEGSLQVSDDSFTTRDPVHLSLGTCQQLYLSMRIALLMAADNVGRAIPILADDILVNFDAERREGAARALAELARSRQVILFTCHEEIVQVMKAVSENTHIISLS